MNGRAARILRCHAESTYGKLLRDHAERRASSPHAMLPSFAAFNRRFKRRFTSLSRPQRAQALQLLFQVRKATRVPSPDAVRTG